VTRTPTTLRHGAGRSLLAGALWVGVWFSIDLYDSYWRLKSSARRIRTDPEAYALGQEAVLDHALRIAGVHLLLVLPAVLLLHFCLRVWFPSEPPRWRWWRAATILATTASGAFLALDMVLYPSRHTWFPWREWYVDLVHPPVLIAGMGAVAAATLLLALRRYGTSPFPQQRKRLWTSLAGLILLLGGAWLGNRPPSTGPVADNDGPNVVLIGIDSLRPDHLGFYGYERDTAPHIDALLAESVVFDSAWTVMSRTYPSMLSILSGQLPIHHGVRSNLPHPDDLVPDDVVLLPQLLSEHGYETVFTTDDSRFAYMVPETGFQRIVQPPPGIQNLLISAREPYFRLVGGLLTNRIGFAVLPMLEHNQAHGSSYRPGLFVQRASQLLREATHSDRFLYLIHSCVLHAPGDRPWPWHQHYGQQGYVGPNRFRYDRAGSTMAVTAAEQGRPVAEVAEQDVRIYDSGFDMADALVARLMADLEEGGLLDDTIVVLFSDHGEEDYEEDLPYAYYGPNHGYHPYGDGQHRVALAIRFPDGRGAGTRVSDPVRTIDIAPTLAELLDVPLAGPLDGQSMVGLIDGGSDPEPRPLYVETGLTEQRYWNEGHRAYPWKNVTRRFQIDRPTRLAHVRSDFADHVVSVKDRIYQVGEWKLVWRPMEEGPARVELFQRTVDPVNRHDLAASHPDVVARLGLPLAELLAEDGIAEPRAEGWALILQQPVPPAVAALLPEQISGD